MLAVSDPNMIVAGWGIAGLALAGLWQLLARLWRRPVSPDPWGADVERQLPEAQEVCPHCSTPQPPEAKFCAGCDRPVGPYHSFTPYVFQFSDGNAYHSDAAGHFHVRRLVVAGYLLLSVSLGFLAPFYWLAWFVKLLSAEDDFEKAAAAKTSPR